MVLRDKVQHRPKKKGKREPHKKQKDDRSNLRLELGEKKNGNGKLISKGEEVAPRREGRNLPLKKKKREKGRTDVLADKKEGTRRL